MPSLPGGTPKDREGHQGPGHPALDTSASQGGRAPWLSTWALELDQHGFEPRVSSSFLWELREGTLILGCAVKPLGGGVGSKNADANASLSQTWIQLVSLGPDDIGAFKRLPSVQVIVIFYYFLPR